MAETVEKESAPSSNGSAPDDNRVQDVTPKASQVNGKLQNLGKPSKPHLILPCAHQTIRDSAKVCFEGMAKLRRYFVRNGEFVTLGEDGNLKVLLPREFVSRIEGPFDLVKYYSTRDGLTLTPSRCSIENANALLGSEEMLEYSLPLRLIAALPVLIERNRKPEILGKGYHEEVGGIYVLRDLTPTPLSLPEAVKALTEELFADYNWVTTSDLSRAVAQVLSPALKLGDLLPGADFPIDLGLADQSQGGKTRRMKFTARIYGEHAYPIVNRKGGVGSLDETIASALCSGRLFILFDNVRGDFDSQLLESILRGTGWAAVRLPYRSEVVVRTDQVITQITSNAATFTKDFANRSIITNHRKRSPDYKPKLPWGEDFLVRIEECQEVYLGAVHAVIAEWIRKGKPRTSESRHDFKQWVQSLDWIVQNIFRLPPLMDGHQAIQTSLSNKIYAWFRQVVLALVEANGRNFPITFQAKDVLEICDTYGVEIPGSRVDLEEKIKLQIIGQKLGPIFREKSYYELEGLRITRTIFKSSTYHEEKKYTIFPIPEELCQGHLNQGR
jgi:hypothetical protein